MLILIALCTTLVIAFLFGRLLADASRCTALYAAFERDLSESVNKFKENLMLDFDANGIALDAYGNRTYKRYAELMMDGRRVMGGVYIGQSTAEVYLVELHEVESETRQGDYKTEVWKPTGQLASVHLTSVIRVFEPHADPPHEMPADEVDDLARFIISYLNIAPIFLTLRASIALNANLPPAPKGYSWDHNTVDLLLSLPQARKIVDANATSYGRICAACKVLDHAVELMRGAG